MSHRCRCRCGNLRQSRLYVILERCDVTFSFYDDAERNSQGNIPSSLWHHDLGQVSLLLHLKAWITNAGEGRAEQGELSFQAAIQDKGMPKCQVSRGLPMVALSVSISASRSPSLSFSPTFFSQRCTVPIVMVGERAGSVTCNTHRLDQQEK